MRAYIMKFLTKNFDKLKAANYSFIFNNEISVFVLYIILILHYFLIGSPIIIVTSVLFILNLSSYLRDIIIAIKLRYRPLIIMFTFTTLVVYFFYSISLLFLRNLFSFNDVVDIKVIKYLIFNRLIILLQRISAQHPFNFFYSWSILGYEAEVESVM
jgi:hypothetical protein